MMNANDIRKVFIGQVNFVNEIAKDIKKNGCTEEVIKNAKQYAHLENEYGEFWRVNWGGAYAYVDINTKGKPTKSKIWWNNDEIGCDGLDYKGTIKRLEEMTEEEILNLDEVGYIEDSETINDYLPLKYDVFMD